MTHDHKTKIYIKKSQKAFTSHASKYYELKIKVLPNYRMGDDNSSSNDTIQYDKEDGTIFSQFSSDSD